MQEAGQANEEATTNNAGTATADSETLRENADNQV